MRLLIFVTFALILFGCQEARNARALKKQHKVDAVPMNGMLMCKADAAAFVQCNTRERFVVKFKGDWLEAEREYVYMAEPGELVYVEFRGRLESDSTDGHVRAGVIIEELTNMRPDTVCQN